MTGTFAYLAAHEAEMRAGRWVAGLNLDMVGADQNATGSSWELVGLPQAGASFSDHLLSWLREPMLDGVRHRETGFSAGSDHYILSDPSVGIPTPMLIQWPDKYYHTSADTPEKVSPDSLARSGTLAAAYACWLANAGSAEVAWLAHLMVSQYAGRAAAEAAEAVASGKGDLARFERRHAFRAERIAAALGELVRLDAGFAARLPDVRREVADIAARELAWAREQAGESHSMSDTRAADEPWRTEAAALYPRRTSPGPIDVGMALQADHPELLPRFWALGERGGHALYDAAVLLQYWADGSRHRGNHGLLRWRRAPSWAIACLFPSAGRRGPAGAGQRRGGRMNQSISTHTLHPTATCRRHAGQPRLRSRSGHCDHRPRHRGRCGRSVPGQAAGVESFPASKSTPTCRAQKCTFSVTCRSHAAELNTEWRIREGRVAGARWPRF